MSDEDSVTMTIEITDQLRSPYLQEAYEAIVQQALRGEPSHPGLAETPARAAAALLEMTSGYEIDVAGLFKTFEDDRYDEMIVERGIPFVSLCEHHLLPFSGFAGIGYLASDGQVIGLSKLARLVDAFARRLQIQERLTTQIADALEEHLRPLGSIVIVEAEHSCLACRGIRKSGITCVTSSVRGAIRDKPEARAEALALLRGGAR